ncbi:hypothetical protein BC830DRAFT_1103654 [Chytriomyces sp. MP71]|nr:hypothetical protein BC830DRAFT_1103654 [Chytriomyces sp. MP71]
MIDPPNPGDFALLAAIIINWISAGISVTIFIAFTVQVLWVETIQTGQPLTLQTIASPLNKLLFLILISIILYYASTAIDYATNPEPYVANTAMFLSDIGLGIAETGYLTFSYIRSEHLIKVVHGRTKRAAYIAMRIIPILLLLPATPGILCAIVPALYVRREISLARRALLCVSGVAGLMADTLFVTTYVLFLRRTSLDVEGDLRFRTIARYGVVGCCWLYVSYAIFLVTFVADQLELKDLIASIATAVLNVVALTLVLMKRRVNQLKGEEAPTIPGLRKGPEEQNASVSAFPGSANTKSVTAAALSPGKTTNNLITGLQTTEQCVFIAK